MGHKADLHSREVTDHLVADLRTGKSLVFCERPVWSSSKGKTRRRKRRDKKELESCILKAVLFCLRML